MTTDWVGRAMAMLVRACARRPVLTVVIAVVLAAAAVVYTARTLTFITSPARLLPQQARYVVMLKEYSRDFGALNDIIVAMESADPALSRRYAARLAEELGRSGVAPARISYRIDPAAFDRNGLLYLSVEDLTKLRDRLFDDEAFVEAYALRPTIDQLVEGLNQQFANAIALGFMDLGVAGERQGDLRFIRAVLTQVAARLDGDATYSSPWTAAFSLGHLDDPDTGYFHSADHRLLFLFVRPVEREGDFTRNQGTIDVLRAAIRRLGPEFPGVRAGVTGAPAISSDEMVTALGDSRLATIIAGMATLALLLVSFRRVRAPGLMLVALVVGLAWALGIATLAVGHLNIFSVMFISIVIGIGIDYGIYFLFRYDEERGLGAALGPALERTAVWTGPGIALGALTAAGTFFVLVLTDFQGIREFGVVSGAAVLAAFVAMVTVFPALLALFDRGHRGAHTGGASAPPVVLRARWLERLTGYRKTILVATVLVTALAAWNAFHVEFSYNMLKLQARGVESVVWEERIISRGGRSGFAALASAETLEALNRKRDAFAALPTVARVDSVLLAIPDRQAEKIALVRQLAPLIGPVRVETPGALELDRLRAPLTTLRRRLGIAVEGAEGRKIGEEARAVRTLVETILARLETADVPRVRRALHRLQRELAQDFREKLRRFQAGLDPSPVGLADVPPALRQRFVGASGRLLMRIQPAVDIWQQAGSERFVGDLRTVDPDVTGPPVTSFEAIGLIRRGYVQGSLLAFALVAAVTAVLLRSLRGTVLALVPLGLGVVWTLGLMRALGLEFNLANVWALPLIIGAAAEYGLNVFVRYAEGLATGGPTLARSAVLAVIISGLTSIGGFSSLMIAHHQGIFGLGLLLTVGTAASLVAAIVVLPVLIHVAIPPRRDAGSS